jgi:RNA recognition motif-containing protein
MARTIGSGTSGKAKQISFLPSTFVLLFFHSSSFIELLRVTTDYTMTTKEPPKARTSPSVVDAVAERLGFFFSDANIRQDLFIRRLLLGNEAEYPHQVPIECLLRFNTIKKFTTDEAVVVEAASKITEKLILSDDKKAIGRVKPFTLEQMDDNIPSTLYVSNLPVEDGDTPKYTVSTEDIRKLFEEYGDIVLVKMRFKKGEHTDDDDDLKPLTPNSKPLSKRRFPLGAVLVEFEEVASLEKAAADTLTSKAGEAEEPKRKLKLGDSELQVCMLKDYIDSRKTKHPKSTEKKESSSKKRELEEKLEAVKFEFDWKPGCVIRVQGLPEECDREAIQGAIGAAMDATDVQLKDRKLYVDYSRGQTDGAIRFPEPSDDLKTVCDKLVAGTVEVAGAKVEAAFILDGEEETNYWKNFIDFKTKQMRHRLEERNTRKGGKKSRNRY